MVAVYLWALGSFYGSFLILLEQLLALQGYFFRVFDFVLERFKELSSIIPMLTMVVLITAITKANLLDYFIFGSIFGWMGIASQM